MSFLLSYAYIQSVIPWIQNNLKATMANNHLNQILYGDFFLSQSQSLKSMENFVVWIKSSGNNVNLHSLGTHAVNVVRVKQLYFQNFDWSLMQTTKIVNFTVFFWPVAKSDWAKENIWSVCGAVLTLKVGEIIRRHLLFYVSG